MRLASPFMLLCALDARRSDPRPVAQCSDCGREVSITANANFKLSNMDNFPTVIVCVECGVKRAARGRMKEDLS